MVCARAAERHEERGDYARALESLSPFWDGPQSAPDVSGLQPAAGAAVLLRAGSLTAWIGSKRQLEGWQESAKNLLSESAALSESAGDRELWLDARKHLAICYWREGSFAEARMVVHSALAEANGHRKGAVALKLTLALIARSEGQLDEAMSIHRAIAEEVATLGADLTWGMFHNGLGLTYKQMGATDDAIIELTAAAYYFEVSSHARYRIPTEINLANLFVLTKQQEAAHARLDQAERLAKEIRDEVHLAQAKDSRALAFLAEGNYEAAEAAARESVAILERGDEHALLVDSLTTHARALMRLRDHNGPLTYARAYSLAVERISLKRAARVAIELQSELAAESCLSGHLTMDEAIDCFEAGIISAALAATNGRITETAMRLGLSQQNLSAMLNARHSKLRPPTTRKRRQRKIITR